MVRFLLHMRLLGDEILDDSTYFSISFFPQSISILDIWIIWFRLTHGFQQSGKYKFPFYLCSTWSTLFYIKSPPKFPCRFLRSVGRPNSDRLNYRAICPCKYTGEYRYSRPYSLRIFVSNAESLIFFPQKYRLWMGKWKRSVELNNCPADITAARVTSGCGFPRDRIRFQTLRCPAISEPRTTTFTRTLRLLL